MDSSLGILLGAKYYPPAQPPSQGSLSHLSHLHTRICHPTSIRPSLLCSQQPLPSYVMETETQRLVMYFQWQQRKSKGYIHPGLGSSKSWAPSSSLRQLLKRTKVHPSTLVMTFSFTHFLFPECLLCQPDRAEGSIPFPSPELMLLPLRSEEAGEHSAYRQVLWLEGKEK